MKTKVIIKNMSEEKTNELLKIRDYKVVKANSIIQKSRFNLSVQEQKIILYLISKIKPNDMELKEQVFEIQDFCKVCGIDYNNGKNYKNIKETIQALSDKSMWVTIDDIDTETLIRWIYKAKINKKSGTIVLKLDEDLKPYLLNTGRKFTQYELYYILAMKSQYAIRLYEILKSYEFKHEQVEFDIEQLKKILFAENYTRFPDFKRKVLDIAMQEINGFSDINIDYEIEKEGRKYVKIIFTIKLKKNVTERLKTWDKIESVINPKKSLKQDDNKGFEQVEINQTNKY